MPNLGRAAYRLNSIKTVSIVKSRFQFARQCSLLGSTWLQLVSVGVPASFFFQIQQLFLTFPVRWSTQGRFTLETNWMVGGWSGYVSPQWMLTL
jgi:hypothetical protein